MGRLLLPVLCLVLITGALGLAGQHFSALPGSGMLCGYGEEVGPVSLEYRHGEIPERVNRSLIAAETSLDEIAAIPDDQRTFGNTLARYDDLLSRFDAETAVFSLLSEVSLDPVIGGEARDAAGLRASFLQNLYLRQDIAAALAIPRPPDAAGVRLKESVSRDFQWAFLEPETRNRITDTATLLSAREAEYRMAAANGSALASLQILGDILALRQEVAAGLGYPSYAALQASLSGFPANVSGIREILSTSSASASRSSRQEAAALQEKGRGEDPAATTVLTGGAPGISLSCPDIPCSSSLDEAAAATNRYLSSLLGIRITCVSSGGAPGPVYSLFLIREHGSRAPLAWFFLIQRQSPAGSGISGETWYLRPGRTINGHHTPAVSAIVITTPSTGPGQGSPMTREDLAILFHEYGHMLRHSLSLNPYGILSGGSREETGYNEVFSTFFERLSREPGVISLLCTGAESRYDGNASLSSCTDIDRRERDRFLYDVTLSLLDLSLHEGASGEGISPDFSRQYTLVYTNLTGYTDPSGGAPLLTSPGFLGSGNAGIYWHYVIGQIHAGSLLSRFRADGLLNQSSGIAFRQEVLARSGLQDPGQLIPSFTRTRPESSHSWSLAGQI